MKKKWEKRFKEVTSNFEAVDLIVKKKYHVQAGIDTIDLAVKSRWMTNKQFAAELFKMLKGKYYWRDWIVLVYNQISGWKNQAVSQKKLFILTCLDCFLTSLLSFSNIRRNCSSPHAKTEVRASVDIHESSCVEFVMQTRATLDYSDITCTSFV
jgi:hypothetical protein